MPAAPAGAYEKEGHYVFVYYLARQVGYTVCQARQIASADWGIDTDPNTEPFQLGEVVNPWGDAQTPRRRQHAFADAATFEADYDREYRRLRNEHYGNAELMARRYAALRAAIARAGRMRELWQQAVSTGNPGAYLHYLQDVYAHQSGGIPYGTFWGHLADGHTADYLSASAVLAEQMARAVIKDLQAFMREYLDREPKAVDMETVKGVLRRVIAENPPPTQTYNPLAYIWNTYWPWSEGPDWQRTRNVIVTALHEPVPDELGYRFSDTGAPLDAGGGGSNERKWALVDLRGTWQATGWRPGDSKNNGPLRIRIEQPDETHDALRAILQSGNEYVKPGGDPIFRTSAGRDTQEEFAKKCYPGSLFVEIRDAFKDDPKAYWLPDALLLITTNDRFVLDPKGGKRSIEFKRIHTLATH